jgi:hypothetical protein
MIPESTRSWLLAALLAGGLAMAGPGLASEAGTALKADDIKAEPFRDAKKTGAVAAGDRVEIVTRSGGWFQVKSARGNGWVRMLSIRRGEARKAGGGAGDVLGLASGRAGTGKVVATTGIRGLSEEDLKSAKFDAVQLKRMESFAVSRGDAQKFAAQGRLSARKVDNLPAPAGK